MRRTSLVLTVLAGAGAFHLDAVTSSATTRAAAAPRPLTPRPRCRPVQAALASLRLITFDLDDTLWPTGPVVRAANDKVAAAMGADADDLQARLRAARSGAIKPSYSEARILAIESWLHEHGGGARPEAEQLFETWLAERHAAAERLLFDGAAEAVAAVRDAHPDALLAAVTNGRGDPLAMPSLQRSFDFTISAEDAAIWPARKPEAAPFLAALRKAGVARPAPALWAHVGDDLVNDVQAAKKLGAWSVWLDPAAGSGAAGSGPASSPDDAAGADRSYWFSTMSEDERAARRALAEAARGSADATIRAIAELPAALSPASRRRGRACPIPGVG